MWCGQGAACSHASHHKSDPSSRMPLANVINSVAMQHMEPGPLQPNLGPPTPTEQYNLYQYIASASSMHQHILSKAYQCVHCKISMVVTPNLLERVASEAHARRKFTEEKSRTFTTYLFVDLVLTVNSSRNPWPKSYFDPYSSAFFY